MQPKLGFFTSYFGDLSTNSLFFSLKNVNKPVNSRFTLEIAQISWRFVTLGFNELLICASNRCVFIASFSLLVLLKVHFRWGLKDRVLER